ncbi:MAG: hypothetical protein RL346_192 [Verrucomicrobiota bacterium]
MDAEKGRSAGSISTRFFLGGLACFWIEDFEDFSPGLGCEEVPSDLAIGEHFRDRGKGAEMQVVILAGNDKENDEMHRCIVEGLELDPLLGAPEDGDDLFKRVGESMGDRHSGADPGADLGFPFLQGLQDLLVAVFRNIPAICQEIDQLHDGGPMLGGFHIQKDMIKIEQLT